MIAGSEAARLITEFEQAQKIAHDNQRYHEQTPSVHHAFDNDVQSFVAAIEELGNPLLEGSTDLIALDTKEMASASYVQTVRNSKKNRSQPV